MSILKKTLLKSARKNKKAHMTDRMWEHNAYALILKMSQYSF